MVIVVLMPSVHVNILLLVALVFSAILWVLALVFVFSVAIPVAPTILHLVAPVMVTVDY